MRKLYFMVNVTEVMSMKKYVKGLWGISGIGLLAILVVVPVGAADKPVTGDKVLRETQEAVTATKDYTIQRRMRFSKRSKQNWMKCKGVSRSFVGKSSMRRRKHERTSRRPSVI